LPSDSGLLGRVTQILGWQILGWQILDWQILDWQTLHWHSGESPCYAQLKALAWS